MGDIVVSVPSNALTVEDASGAGRARRLRVLPRPTGNALRLLYFLVCAIGVLLISKWVLLPTTADSNLKSSEFSVDEPGWVAASYYYTDLLKAGDFDWSKWDCPQCGSGSSYGSLNMHLGEWLIGFPLENNDRNKPRFSGYYDVDKTLDENTRLGQVPSRDVLIRARWAPAIFGALCCAAVFAIGFWAYNGATGLLATALLLLNAVFLRLSAQVMTDTFYNFFLLAGCAVAIAAFRLRGGRLRFALAGLYGLTVGCACSVKVTGFVSGVFFFVLAAGWLRWRKRATTPQILVAFAFSSVCMLTVVYAMNPLFWPTWRDLNPRATWAEVRSLSSELGHSKKAPWRNREQFVADERYPQLKNLSRPLEFPLLFARWRHMMQEQQQRGWDGWKGPRVIALSWQFLRLSVPSAFGFASNAAVMVFAVVIILPLGTLGIVAAVRSVPRHRGAVPDEVAMVPVLYFVANYLLIVLFMKLNWDRYYLPTLLASEVIVAAGAVDAARRVSALVLPMWKSRGNARVAKSPATV